MLDLKMPDLTLGLGYKIIITHTHTHTVCLEHPHCRVPKSHASYTREVNLGPCSAKQLACARLAATHGSEGTAHA